MTDDETRGLVERFYAVLWNPWDDGAVDGRLPPGGRFRYSAAAFFECEDGRIISAWVLGDLDGLRRQLSPG